MQIKCLLMCGVGGARGASVAARAEEANRSGQERASEAINVLEQALPQETATRTRAPPVSKLVS